MNRRNRRALRKGLRASAGLMPGMDVARRAASSTDQVMRSWNPPLREPDSSWGRERNTAVARTRDLVQNEGWAASYVSRQTAQVVGQNLRFSSRPRLISKRLGIDLDVAKALARQIETAFEIWANDPLSRADWEGDLTFGGLVNLLARDWFANGEGLAVLRWDDEPAPGWAWRTSVQVIDADRLSNPHGVMDRLNFRNGVERDADGRRAIAYHIREAHPADPVAWGKQIRWERVPVATDWGRPVILHLRAKTRPGETRGVSKLVAALRKLKMLARYSDSELQTAAVNALFAAVIYSNQASGAGLEDLLQISQLNDQAAARSSYYSGADPRLSDGSRIAKLYPGDQMDVLTAQRPGGNYAQFQTAFLQAIASGLDTSYEQLAADWSKTNYSSGRMALVENWRHVIDARAIVSNQIAFPILLAIVEEAIDLGLIDPPSGAPDLYENPAGWLAGEWVGPGRGWVDPVKEAQGAALRIATGLSSHEREAAEQGVDWESNLGQLQDERSAFASAGFVPPSIGELMGGGAALNDAADEAADPRPDDTQEQTG